MTSSKALRVAELDPRTKRCVLNLPKPGQAKCCHLLDLRDAANRWSDTNYERTQELARRKQQVDIEIARYERYRRDQLVEDDLEKKEALNQQAAALRAAIEESRGEQNPFGAPPDEFDRALLRLGDKPKLRDARVTAPLLKGESERDALKRKRTEIKQYEADIKAARSAQVEPDEVKQRVKQSIYALAESGAPEYLDCLSNRRGRDGDRVIHWPSQLIVEKDRAREIGDGMALLAYVFRDELIERLTARALEQHRGGGLSDVERRRRLAEIEAKLLRAEREEEDLVSRLEAAKSPVRREFRFTDNSAVNERRLLAILGIARAAADEDLEDFG